MDPTPSLILMMALLAPPAPAGAPALQVPGARAVEADSARVIREARREQERFERFRRLRLPRTGHGGAGECDEKVGRFCLWHGRSDGREPPEEAAPVGERRERLLERLATAATLQPGDPWIAGQRVFYLVEAGRPEAAIAALAGCAAEPWWCAALEGYAHHAAGTFPAAEIAFDRALRAMPPQRAERWTDIEVLLETDDLRRIRRLEAEDREALVRRLWWLSDPLWMVPGNERRTEHLARRVGAEISARSASTEGFSWGRDLEELLLRYGAPTSWEWVRSAPWSTAAESMRTYHASGARSFVPRIGEIVDHPVGPGAFALDRSRARSRYAPAYARFQDIEPQVAVFRREAESVVVAAYSIPADSLVQGDTLESTLFLVAAADGAPHSSAFSTVASTGSLTVRAPARPTILSLEVLARGSRRAFRSRQGLVLEPLPSGVRAISDILLLRDAEPLPGSLEEAAPRARGADIVEVAETFGLFWELYGVEGEVLVSVTIAGRTGGLRRLAQAVGLAAPRPPLRVRWREQPAGGSVSPRALAISIPDLSPGTYTLRVAAESPGAEPLVSSREIRVDPLDAR
jgi:hypothetical protein